MRVRIWLGLTGVAAIGGLLFASVSTYDFVAHLDRQVHGLHCSFIPGMSSNDPAGAAGCQATMMSPYSSVFRDDVWGGIPISLPAMGVFAFLLFFAAWIALRDRASDARATGFLLLGTLVPVIASVV
ncbi:MAG: hypothetical protein H5U40_10380, partial [Polyangiaceae bacterium]|nr:hypothetical protein [Polyangiaceae bacterium]